MIVTLEPWEYIHAHDIGIKRFVANWKVKDQKAFTQGKNQPEIIASPAAAICELAVAKALDRFWTGHVWDNRDHKSYNAQYRDLVDIEVRRIRGSNNPFAIKPKDLGKNSILVVAHAIPDEFRQVDIKGWIPADIAWEKGTEVEGYGYKTLSQSFLKPLDKLKDYKK